VERRRDAAVEQANMERVRAMFVASNERRRRESVGLFHDDLVLDASELPQPDFAGIYEGVDGFERWFSTWRTAWADLKADMLWLRAHDDIVVAWLHMRMIGKGSGVPVEIDGGWAFKFRDGRVERVRLIADEARARDALFAGRL
jgi:ketosteroid isomerase-like protein